MSFFFKLKSAILILVFIYGCKSISQQKMKDDVVCSEVSKPKFNFDIPDSLYSLVLKDSILKFVNSDSLGKMMYTDNDDFSIVEFRNNNSHVKWIYSDKRITTIEIHEEISHTKIYDYGNCVLKEITRINDNESEVLFLDYKNGGKCYSIGYFYGDKTIKTYLPIKNSGYPLDSLNLSYFYRSRNIIPVMEEVYYKDNNGNEAKSMRRFEIDRFLKK